MNRLAKVLVELPNHWAQSGTESLWARKIGEDLYEVENVPFLAYGLNYRDVVRAVAPSGDEKPIVREVVRRGGHTTFRVVFRNPEEPRTRRIAVLTDIGASFESWGDSFFALDVAPGGDIGAVLERLERLEKLDVLGFETCEARVRGSFDDEDNPSLRPG